MAMNGAGHGDRTRPFSLTRRACHLQHLTGTKGLGRRISPALCGRLREHPVRMVHPPRFARGTVANQATVILNSPRVVEMVPHQRFEL